MIIKCPECGHQVSSMADNCPNCGIAIKGNTTQCPHCGGTLLAGQDVCPNCLQSIYSNTGSTVYDDADADRPTADGEADGQNGKPAASRHSALWATLATVLVIVLGVMFIGYYFYRQTQQQNERYAYDNCMHSNQPEVLQTYLDVYAAAPLDHRDSVTARLQVLKRIDQDWQNANAYPTKLAYQKYLQKHPGSSHTKEAEAKIDSLDWIAAATQNTPASYKAYMDEHANGRRYNDALMNYNRLTDRLVSESDEQMVMQLFTTFFTSIGSGDEDALKGTLATVLNSFMQKRHASKWDVVDYVRKMHEDKDIKAISFAVNGDWKIDKIESVDSGEMEFAVAFTVEQRTERTKTGATSKENFKVSARVSAGGKITDMNMKKVGV